MLSYDRRKLFRSSGKPAALGFPFFFGAGAPAFGTGNVTPGLPAGILTNDILLLFAATPNQAIALPTGWAEVLNSPQGTGTAGAGASTRMTMFWLRVAGGEIAPTLIDAWDNCIAAILAFRGCITTGNPWDVTAGDVGALSASVSVPGAITTVVKCLVVLACSQTTDTLVPQFSGWANPDLSSVVELADLPNDTGNGGGFGVAVGRKASIGAYGATTATLATASAQGRMSVALKPPP